MDAFANECDSPFPNVGAVYDGPQLRGLHSSELRAVIDRPYIGEWGIAFIHAFHDRAYSFATLKRTTL
jgi:hypothetical protein